MVNNYLNREIRFVFVRSLIKYKERLINNYNLLISNLLFYLYV